MEDLKKLIREVPDFPKPGINFYDITTLLKDPSGLEETIDALTEQCRGLAVDTVIGVESRGFIFGAPLAYQLGVGFIPVRKPKKLPSDTVSVSYELEYGTDSLEMHKDAVGEGHNVLDRKSTRLNSSHSQISYAVFCLKKKNNSKNNLK